MTAPQLQDPVTGPYWTAAAEGRLVVQHCLSCDALRWPPLVGCPECLSREVTWVDVQPVGTVWSFVVYHRAFQVSLADDIPYTVAMVQLDAGPYVVGRLVDTDEAIAVGSRVTAEFFVTGDLTSVRWRIT